MVILLNILYPLLALTIIGLPVVISLMDKEDWSLGLFISPIFGLIIYSSINLFFITFISTPFNPLYFFYLYLPGFAFICILKKSFLVSIPKVNAYWIFFIVPAAAICIISYLVDEPTFISAGQDEIQYVNNALFMINHQNTHDFLDTLTPRIDHWLTDAVTTTLTYNHGYRRGAELILGLMIRLTGENPYISFSYTCLLGLAIYLISVPPLLKYCFTISLRVAIFFQLFMTISWIWIMLTFQGSLANILSLSLIAVPLIANPKLINLLDFRKSILAGILLSGPVIFYSEAALILSLIPFGLISIINYWKSKKLALRNLIAFFITFLSLSHISIYSLIKNNYIALTNSSALGSLNVNAIDVSQFTNLWSPIFGLYSLYASTYSNQHIASFISIHSLLVLTTVFLIYSTAIYGSLLSTKINLAGFSFAVCLTLLVFIIFSSIAHGNFLIASRGSQYSYQLSIIGIFLSIYFVRSIFVKCLSIALILVLFCLNINSILGTYSYFKQIPATSDTFITRYSPNFKNWISLIERINLIPEGPVLIAGYPGTAKPHFISSAIEPRGSIISSDIQKFWDLYSIPLLGQQKNFSIYDILSLSNQRVIDGINYKEVANQLATLTDIAIVDENSSDPIDWANSDKLVTRARWRFTPIGDVLEKKAFSNIQLMLDGKPIVSEYKGPANIKDSLTLSYDCKIECNDLFYELVFSKELDLNNLYLPIANTEYKINKNRLVIHWKGMSANLIQIRFKKDVVLTRLYLLYQPTF